MRLTAFPLVLALALALHAIPRLALPLSSDLSAREIPTSDISLPKPELQTAILNPLSKFPPPSHARLIIPDFNKNIYPVSGTDVVLTIRLGERLDGASLASFLHVAHDVVVQGIARFGGIMGLPTNISKWDLGQDLEFVAESSQDLAHPLTWALTRDAVEGLQRFLIESKRDREASCTVNLANAAKSFVGFVNVRRKKLLRRINPVRNLPVLPSTNNKNVSTLSIPVGQDPNVHIDFHPSFFSRLNIHDVIGLLAVTKDWALENMERTSPHQPIDHGAVWKTLGDGIRIKMAAAPRKSLTYGLVVETVERLLRWEINQCNARGTARAVDFAILELGVLKGTGSIKKDRGQRMDVAR
ncbi:MAG: hypothetical protein Q9213_002690 [Squamulea squamosa]